MPLPKGQVLSVEDICTELGYNNKQKPYRQYDLTMSTREWRESYISSDGIPGRDITDWGSDKGNHDIKTMSRKFLECGYGTKHWPPGSGQLEYPRDEKKLLELSHQLFWRQNLAAKNNQISKEKRGAPRQESQKQTLNTSSDHLIDTTGAGYGDVTHSAHSLRARRTAPTNKRTYVDICGDGEEEDDQSKPSLIFKKKFVLNLAQYRELPAAFSTTSLAPVANMTRQSAEPVTPGLDATNPRKPMLEDGHVSAKTLRGEHEISDSDSEPVISRRVINRRRNVSGLARRSREDDAIDRMRRRRSSRTRVVAGATNYREDTSSTPQSPPGWDIFSSKLPIQYAVCNVVEKENSVNVPHDDDSTRRISSTGERNLLEGSVEIPMSAKSLRCRSTIQERMWRSTPTTSVGFEPISGKKPTCVPPTHLSRGATGGSRNPDDAYPSPIDTQAETPGHSARSNRETSKQIETAESHQSDEVLRTQPYEEVTTNCHRCKRLHRKCSRSRPCNRCKAGEYECVYHNNPNAEPLPSAPYAADPTLQPVLEKTAESSSSLSGTLDQISGTPITQPNLPNIPTPAAQHPPPNPTAKPKSVKYYILASGSSGQFEEPWSGLPLSEMTMDSLLTQAATHTSGREVLKVKFTLSSLQPGFVGRKDVVDKEDAGSLGEVEESFRMGRREGLKKGFSRFRILLEPELAAQTVVEESEDADDI